MRVPVPPLNLIHVKILGVSWGVNFCHATELVLSHFYYPTPPSREGQKGLVGSFASEKRIWNSIHVGK